MNADPHSITQVSPAVGLPDHSGKPAPFDFHFFASPPSEIGTVLSAESTVGSGKGPWPMTYRFLKCLMAAGVAFLLFFLVRLLQSYDYDARHVPGMEIAGWGAAGVIFVIWFFVTRPKAVCSYVGSHGVVRFTRNRGKGKPLTVDQLLFEDAKSFEPLRVDQFLNGIYNCTSYKYIWRGDDNQVIFRLRGLYRGRQKPPRQGDPFHFARAAEIGCVRYHDQRFGRVERHCKQCGYDLTGNVSGICPECGKALAAEPPPARNLDTQGSTISKSGDR